MINGKHTTSGTGKLNLVRSIKQRLQSQFILFEVTLRFSVNILTLTVGMKSKGITGLIDPKSPMNIRSRSMAFALPACSTIQYNGLSFISTPVSCNKFSTLDLISESPQPSSGENSTIHSPLECRNLFSSRS